MPVYLITSTALRPARFLARSSLTASALLLATVWLLCSAVPAHAQGSIVEEYFVPLPENDIDDSFEEINSAAQEPILTSISIAVGGNSLITYDQWEDGYEATLGSPLNIFSSGAAGCPAGNPSGTQIWGNGDACDGIPPNLGVDILSNGDVILLENAVSVPRDPSQIRFDGADKFGSTYPVAVTRIAVPHEPGAVLSGGVEVLKTGRWGTEYRTPVGPSESGNTNPWQYTTLFVMASVDNTEVMKNGATVAVIDQGENLVILADINDLIVSDKPVQVDLITGDENSSYEMRWYSLPPVDRWSDEYFMPVGDALDQGESEAAAWFYNPSQSASITVRWEIGSDTGSINVPAGEARFGPYVGGSDGRDGARFYSDGGAQFYALAQIDADSGGEIYDWGFPLDDKESLSPQVLIGNGRGCTNPLATISGDSCHVGDTDNARSPVWIMPDSGSDVPIYVAFDGRLPTCPAGGGDYDETFTLDALRIRTVQDPADLDMSGARIWTCVPQVNLAGAWGQDPPQSYSGDDQGLDLGTAVVPLPSIQLEKASAFAIDADQDGSISPGDTITFTLAVVNNGAYPTTISVEDSLPPELVYELSSTTYEVVGGSVTPVPDDPAPRTPFPLDEGGLDNIGGNPIVVGPGEVVVFSYIATINPQTDCTLTLENRASIEAQFPDAEDASDYRSGEIIVLECNPGIDVEKSTNGEDADNPTGPYIDEGAPVTWNYVVTNIGDIDLVGVNLDDDVLGPITNCTPAIPDPFPAGDSFTCSANGSAELGQYENLATVNATSSISETVVVSDTDPSHYFGQDPAITIIKFTNGHDANFPPGPAIHSGDPVNWTYEVTNSGNVTLTNVAVTDDQIGFILCPQDILAPGESMTCTASGVAQEGQYANTGSVIGTPPAGDDVADDDPSHYFGTNPSVEIKKYTNGYDADSPPGPAIVEGSAVLWTYVVTNTGNVPMVIEVTDAPADPIDPVVDVVCYSNVLSVGANTFCAAVGIADLGQYTNTGTVVGTPTVGPQVSDDDPSHYIGTEFVSEGAGVHIEKLTNLADADLPTGPHIRAGDPVAWTYIVINTGTDTLIDVTVSDDQNVTVTCPTDVLESFLSQSPLPQFYMFCTATGTAVPGQYANVGTVEATTIESEETEQLLDSDPSHYFGEDPSIDIEKSTNGDDADTPTGPYIPIGDAVQWDYEVTNTGNVTLAAVTVTDDQNVPVNCPAVTLGIGESMTCVGNPGIAQAGQYANSATATGLPPSGPAVTDTDPSHYFGSNPSIDIEKHTNGVDADDPTGPIITPGDLVNWEYIVTNTGNVILTGITVTDDQGVTITCTEDVLPAGESMTCTASSTAEAGQYENVGSVIGTPPVGAEVSDTDPSHYFGPDPAIDIEKYTNGVDADTETGPLLVVGSQVRWTYEVVNTGNVDLINPSVTDSQGAPLVCPRLTLLPTGGSFDCHAVGAAIEGQYTNVGTVVATPITEGPDVSDSDPSHYFGVLSSIDLEKSTNGEDADAPTGPFVTIGDPVLWRYDVTNTSNAPLRDIQLADDQLGPITCPQTDLAIAETMTCTANGVSVEGQYENTADVIGYPPVGAEVVDEDPSHYYGRLPTALDDDDQPAAPQPIFLPRLSK